jgi:hypothetical protein
MIVGSTCILGIVYAVIMTIKKASMTGNTLATTGYCTALKGPGCIMTLLTRSTAGSAGTVMDCGYYITCMTTNTVNRRAARIAVNQDVTEARIRMIQLMEVPVRVMIIMAVGTGTRAAFYMTRCIAPG